MIRNIWIVCWAFTFAIGLSQIPSFTQQYLQAVNSAAAELKKIVDGDRKDAQEAGLTMEQYVAQFTSNSNSLFVKQGNRISGRIEREEFLIGLRDKLLATQEWLRPFVILIEPDVQIFEQTALLYSFTLALDPLYAFVGALLSLIINSLFFVIFRRA